MKLVTFLQQKGSVLLGCPLLLLYACSSNRDAVRLDADRWLEILNSPLTGLAGVAYLLGYYSEFRTLFYYRLGTHWRPLTWLLQIFWPGCPALYLNSRDIGPGLYIQHGFATVVDAHRIGRNCWINQQVTIGYAGCHQPSIGDNVRIAAGSIIVGNVTVGDNAVIGAGAVVVRDVPENSTVVGPAARVVRLNGLRLDTAADTEGPASIGAEVKARPA